MDLDWADEEVDLDAYAAAYGATAEVIVEHGPAGGFPIVRFEGEWDSLVDILTAYDADLARDAGLWITPS